MSQNTAYNVTNGPFPFSHAMESDHVVYLSGQPAMELETGTFLGGSFAEQFQQCFANLDAVLQEAGLSKKGVVKCTVFLIDMRDYPEMNDLYAKYFEKPYPARSCFAVNGLPLGARIEVEMIAHRHVASDTAKGFSVSSK